MFGLKKLFNLKKMNNKNGAKPRKIDESVKKTTQTLGSQFALISRMEIKAWKAYLALFFIAGLTAAIIFSVQTNIQTKSSAKSTKLSQAEELAQIQKAIKGKKAKWVAKDNPVFRLSNEEKKKRANAKIPSASEVEQNYNPPSAGETPPATLDWRNNGGNFVTPVKNQGNCGSCWAFGTTAALESYTLIKDNQPGTNLDLSEQVVVSCSGAGSCSGGTSSGASRFILDTGVPVESCYPYTATNGVCTNACANWQASAYKIGAWSFIAVSSSQSSLPAIKQAIATYGPISTMFQVYSDFTGYSSGVYSYTTGNYLGNHIVEIVGYDDVGQYFIAKNSWGSGWGESGYFRIAYSEVGGKSNFGWYSIAYTGTPLPPSSDTTAPTVSITAPASGATVTGTTTVTASASDNVGVSKVEFYVDNNLQSSDTSSPYSFNWNVAGVADGTHTLLAKAYDAAGNVGISASVGVNVSNTPQPADETAPTVTLKSPTDGGIFTKKVVISATASDNVKVVSMRGFIDSKQVCSSTTGTLGCSVNILKKYTLGLHAITVEAADAAGLKGTAAVNVTFK
ncbi:MAG: C1 family peptidase [Candidatus Moraniibacteriota bacterium]